MPTVLALLLCSFYLCARKQNSLYTFGVSLQRH